MFNDKKSVTAELNSTKRRSIDLLVDQFWKYGYTTLKRKFGTYLPEPGKVGCYDIDIVARQRKDYAIGIALSPEEINDPSFLERVVFLATRQTKFSNKSVELFVGAPADQIKKVKLLIDSLDPEVKRNIRVVSLVDPQIYSDKLRKDFNKPLFV